MLAEFVLISFMTPDIPKTFNNNYFIIFFFSIIGDFKFLGKTIISSVFEKSIWNHIIYMTIDDIVLFLSLYFKTVNAKNYKVDNCANVSIATFTVNLSVLFCLRMEKVTHTTFKKLSGYKCFCASFGAGSFFVCD